MVVTERQILCVSEHFLHLNLYVLCVYEREWHFDRSKARPTSTVQLSVWNIRKIGTSTDAQAGLLGRAELPLEFLSIVDASFPVHSGTYALTARDGKPAGDVFLEVRIAAAGW